MDDIEEVLETLRIFYGNLEKLRLMEGPEMLLPGRTQTYHQTLEGAEQAYGKIETIISALGHDLNRQRDRLNEGVRRYAEE
ncbi:MAG: hypothetical protein H0V70_08785 [Ktedonobacteraceae bacterium]|nr:hypothetical protein [Ktedonobacteraceae bacterium]